MRGSSSHEGHELRLNAPAAVVGPHNRVVEPRRSGGPEELEVVDASADDSGRGISRKIASDRHKPQMGDWRDARRGKAACARACLELGVGHRAVSAALMREPGATPIEQREDVTRTGSTSYSMEPVRTPLAARKRGGSRRLQQVIS